jgi:hypothetical protein
MEPLWSNEAERLTSCQQQRAENNRTQAIFWAKWTACGLRLTDVNTVNRYYHTGNDNACKKK